MSKASLLVVIVAVLTGQGFSAGPSVDFDGAFTPPAPLSGFAPGVKKAPDARSGGLDPAQAANVDIEVEQESTGPFARWRVRNGRALIFVEKIPAGPTACRVTGPAINIEVGSRGGPVPNYYLRGQWPEAVASNALLTNVLFRIIQENCR